MSEYKLKKTKVEEKVVGTYKKMIETKVSNTYLLQISDYGTTKILADNYFGE